MPEDLPSKYQLITSGKSFTDLVMARVRQAMNEILIDTSTLEFDTFGQPLLSEMEYACQRGLRVRCLLDASGSQNFIKDHPALFTSLQMEFRIRQSENPRDNFIVFDRQLAVVGKHALKNPEAATDVALVSRIVTGTAAAAIADDIDHAWNEARAHGDG